MTRQVRRWISFGVVVLSLVTFGGGVRGRHVWTSDEHRYVEAARGLDWSRDRGLILRLNGDPYVTKPPGYSWAVTALEGLSGLALEKAAMAVSAVAASAIVAAAWGAGTILYGTGVGLGAALVLGTSAQVLSYATRATMDMLLACLITGSLFFYVRHEFSEQATRRRSHLVASGLLAGLGVLVKGPVGLVIPGLVIVTYRWVARAWRREDAPAALLWLVPALGPSALWLVAAIDRVGFDYAQTLVLDHAVGHPLGFVNKREVPWFYLPALLGGFLPWTLLLPAAGRRFARRLRDRHRSDVFVVVWALAPLLLLSLLPAKRNVYLLPLYPALALLLAGQLFGRGRPRETADRWLRLGRAAVAFFAVVLGGAVAGFASLAIADRDATLQRILPSWPLLRQELDPAVPWIAFAIGLMLIGGGGAFRSRFPQVRASAVPFVAVGWALLVLTVVQPVESAGKAEQPFIRAVRPLVGNAILAWYGRRDYSPNWVLERPAVPFLRSPADVERFVAEEREPVFLLAERRSLTRRGWPENAELVLEWPRALAPELVLLRCGHPGVGPGRRAPLADRRGGRAPVRHDARAAPPPLGQAYAPPGSHRGSVVRGRRPPPPPRTGLRARAPRLGESAPRRRSPKQ